MSKIKGAIAIAAVALFLSGCQYAPLPKEERYQFINEVKDAVDLSSAGEIVSESYDRNEGVLSASGYKAEAKGQGIYETVNKRIQAIPGIKDCRDNPDQLTCRYGQVDITLSKYPAEEKVYFMIVDSSSGRTTNGKN